ncbi:MAG: hypothetical protein U0M02_11380 [Acutalibacteraceae bacterium]|nr:hypothetical protein [Acutalibacteraceae bacterium]
MNTLLKKIGVSAAAFVLAASSTAMAVSAEEVTVDGKHMKNGNIDVFVNSTYSASKFALSDSQGQHLLYDCTSRFISSVDGNAGHLYFSDCDLDESTKTITLNVQYNNTDTTATLRIVGNTVTGKEDTVEITMVTKNSDTVDHSVGSRIMLDTMLGDNDRAPYRVTGIGEVTTRIQCSGSEVPLSYNTFDSLTNPKIVTAGTFLPGNAKPDIVQFTNYFISDSYELIPEVDTSRELDDSTVNAIWKERTLAPGQSLTCRTYYGLSAIDVSANTELALGANKSAGTFAVNEEGTGYENVSVMSFLQNTGLFDLSNVEVTLQLPNGVKTSDGVTSKNYESLATGSGVVQDSWVLTAEPSGSERNVKVIVKAKSDQTGEVEPVQLSFVIPAIEGADEIIETEPTTVAPTETTTVPATDNVDNKETKPVATPEEATSKSTPDSTTGGKTATDNNGTVQTGAALPSAIILAVLIIATSALYFYYRKKQN